MTRRTFAIAGILQGAVAGAQTKKQERKPITYRREELLPKIRKLIAKELGLPETKITDKARFVEDLGADSLDHVEMIMNLEDDFDLEITDADCSKTKTLADAVSLIQRLLEAKKRLAPGD